MPAPPRLRINRGATVWLTGLSGAGKSTVAGAVEALVGDETEVEVLDGDEIRKTISTDLGFSRHDRDVQGRRVGFIAELLTRHRVLTLVPVIAPYSETREAVRHQHNQRDSAFFEIYISTPVEECARRDPKGLYAKAAAGEVTGLTGVDDVYERPEYPDLELDTTRLDAETAAQRIVGLLLDRGLAEYAPSASVSSSEAIAH